jgi:hypothetical protein
MPIVAAGSIIAGIFALKAVLKKAVNRAASPASARPAN